ncbi:MAG TPA: site-2 protease family protein [Patescibacteria group bacterium]|nr:site-2 protease family protein [Patescibacteria group bacterium]
MEGIIFLIYIVVFIGSVILHEIAHGYVANRFGDDTARVSGRLSLNPLVHIDPVGSVLVPLLLFVSNSGFLFGWAKPVPVNAYRLRGGAAAYRWVTLAGVATNLVLAVIGILILKLALQLMFLPVNNLGVFFFQVLFQVNLVLAVFNLIPLPGFDGFNFLTTFSPIGRLIAQTPLGNPLFMLRYGLVVSILLLFLFMPYIGALIQMIFNVFIRIFGLT